MRYLRGSVKLLAKILVLAVGCAALLVLAGQIEQHLYRRRVEKFVFQLQQIQLRKTAQEEAQKSLAPWSPRPSSTRKCDAHSCFLEVTLEEAVYRFIASRNFFIRLDDYLRWKFGLKYDEGPFQKFSYFLLQAHIHLGGRPARVIGTLEIRNGVVWGKSLFVSVESYREASSILFSNNWGEYSLFGEARTISRYWCCRFGWNADQLVLHPYYAIGAPGGCEICVAGWVKFTPYADPSDIHRFLDMNLSCLTRWNPCRTQGDLFPNVWPQYRRERERAEGFSILSKCAPFLIESMGRDSPESFLAEVVRVKKYRKIYVPAEASAETRFLRTLKGTSLTTSGKQIEIRFIQRNYCSDQTLEDGSPAIFFRGDKLPNSPADPWSVLPATDENLKIFGLGVAEDYRARDE